MHKKTKLYSQLSEGQRYQISVLRDQGQAMREIAKAIGVNASTVCRELKRNSNGSKYIPQRRTNYVLLVNPMPSKRLKSLMNTLIILKSNLNLLQPVVYIICRVV